MRALPERLHNNGRNLAQRQRDDVRRQEPPQDEHAARREIFHAVSVFTLEVTQHLASDVGNVVSTLLEVFALQGSKLLLPSKEDAACRRLRIDQRGLQLLPELLRRE